MPSFPCGLPGSLTPSYTFPLLYPILLTWLTSGSLLCSLYHSHYLPAHWQHLHLSVRQPRLELPVLPRLSPTPATTRTPKSLRRTSMILAISPSRYVESLGRISLLNRIFRSSWRIRPCWRRQLPIMVTCKLLGRTVCDCTETHATLRPNAHWPFTLSHNRLQTGGWARQQNGMHPHRRTTSRQD